MGKGEKGVIGVIMSTSTSTEIPTQKTKEKNPAAAVNNAVKKLTLDRKSCERL